MAQSHTPIFSDPPAAIAALYIPPANAEHLLIAVRSLERVGIPVVAGGPSGESILQFRDIGCECMVANDPADLINQVWSLHRVPVLAVGDAVSLPDNFLDHALQLLHDDLRVATVSFFSDDAAYLSFPFGSSTRRVRVEGHDARSITRRLRQLGPEASPTPIPAATGAAVLLSSSAIGAIGGALAGPKKLLEGTLAEFSARASARGFINLVDDVTYYSRHRSPGELVPEGSAMDDLDPLERQWVHLRHPNQILFVDHEARDLARSATSPLALSRHVARVKTLGLRVAVDGSYLGPHEMGTQVAILARVQALSRRDDVSEVVVALQSDIPDYAREVLSAPKVRPLAVPFDRLEQLGRCDIAHRMVQPDQQFSVAQWRAVAERVVITVLDLIAYRIGAYHQDIHEWLRYREALRRGLAEADAVTLSSEDTRRQVEMERLPVDPRRLQVVSEGADHLRGDEPVEIPTELLTRGFVEGQFILCLGTDYSHKNKDLALEAVAELRRRGFAHSLVMAGPTVPYGSSRLSENNVFLHERETLEREVFVLPDLPSPQRNWLVRHADLVLYPTSAEGFGLVPFEAARFGTPTVFAGFGPLVELADALPVAAADWSPTSLAVAAEKLLTDPGLARAQVESCLEVATNYTWAATAERLTELYRRTMSMPPR